MGKDDLSRRVLIQRSAAAAGATALLRLGSGCAPRPGTARQIELPCPVNRQLVISPEMAPELANEGGAVQIVVAVSGAQRQLLVANVGTGLIAVDGRCTHAGCPVTWVQEDRQIECPCHLSRFAADGAVLNPPAVARLTAYPAALDAQGNAVVQLAPGDQVFPALQGSALQIDLSAYPALQSPGGAVVGSPAGAAFPLVVARLEDGSVAAFDGRCTHLACTVHPGTQGLLHCPCHGSTFSISPDPSDPQRRPAGWVVTGPAGTPLSTLPSTLSPDGRQLTVQFPPVCP